MENISHLVDGVPMSNFVILNHPFKRGCDFVAISPSILPGTFIQELDKHRKTCLACELPKGIGVYCSGVKRGAMNANNRKFEAHFVPALSNSLAVKILSFFGIYYHKEIANFTRRCPVLEEIRERTR